MPKGVYPRTEAHRKKIGASRKKFYDEHRTSCEHKSKGKVNVCTDMLRQRKREFPAAPEDLDTGSYNDPLPADGSLAERVDALPPEVAAIVKLRFYEELSLKEISRVVDCPLSTVKTRLYTGLKKLRVELEGVEL